MGQKEQHNLVFVLESPDKLYSITTPRPRHAPGHTSTNKCGVRFPVTDEKCLCSLSNVIQKTKHRAI